MEPVGRARLREVGISVILYRDAEAAGDGIPEAHTDYGDFNLEEYPWQNELNFTRIASIPNLVERERMLRWQQQCTSRAGV
jgi:hypothetical protein